MIHKNPAARPATRANEREDDISIADFDLTPHGLDDAPAHQQDTESIVYIGNS